MTVIRGSMFLCHM